MPLRSPRGKFWKVAIPHPRLQLLPSLDDPRGSVFLEGPEGLAMTEDGVEVDLGRSDGFKVKWGRGLEEPLVFGFDSL